MTTSKPLRCLRILVPPSRLDRNPMVPMFERMGAEVVAFPKLYDAPVDPAPLDDVATRLGDFDWIIIAGGGSVDQFFGRLNRLELDAGALRSRDAEKGIRVGAIGFSALKALRTYGVEADYRPKQHFADAVVAGMESVRGRRVLLVRAAGATDALPKALMRQGAEVEALTGHAVCAKGSDAGPDAGLDAGPDAGQTFGRQGLDLAAFVNPATVRLFFESLRQMGVGVEHCLARVPIFAIGPATAESLVTAGLPPDHVAGGRLKLLLDDVIHLAGGGPRGRGV
jgi:uroporphyrinogen-III synthase